MTNSGANYDPTFVECTGFGQNTSNAAPSLFLESIAINLDCSVYGSLFVTNNVEVGKNVEIKGNLAVSGPGSFGGVVSAAGFRVGKNSFGGAAGFVVDSPATFLQSFSAAGNSSFAGLLTAATGVVAQTLSIPPQSSNNQDTPNPAIYRPTNSDGDPSTTPISFVPCVLSQLPPDAVVLAYLPNPNPN
jgi:hypothetical protein